MFARPVGRFVFCKTTKAASLQLQLLMHRLVRREQSSFLICRRKLHRFAGGFFQKQTPKTILFYVLVLLARMLMETRGNLYPALQFSIRPQESHQWGYSQEARSAVSTTAAINSPHVDKNRRHFTWLQWPLCSCWWRGLRRRTGDWIGSLRT